MIDHLKILEEAQVLFPFLFIDFLTAYALHPSLPSFSFFSLKITVNNFRLELIRRHLKRWYLWRKLAGDHEIVPQI